MRSLRAKLFLRVGSLFLIIAILSYLFAGYTIRKDVNAGTVYLTNMVSKIHAKFLHLANTWVTYRFLQVASQLDGVAHSVEIEKKELWEMVASALSYDPDLAVVQAKSPQGEVAVISAESGKIYIPSWAKDAQGKLWIELQNKEFLAEPLKQEPGFYLLIAASREKNEPLLFTPFKSEPSPSVAATQGQDVYDSLQQKEHLLNQKAELIQKLTPEHTQAAGILKVDSTFKKGIALLTDDVFSNIPVLAQKPPSQDPVVVHRGNYVDLMQLVAPDKTGSLEVVVGFSLSEMAKAIANNVQKPVLLYDQKELLQGFYPSGEAIPLNTLSFSDKGVMVQDILYIPEKTQIGGVAFTVLTPESEVSAVPRYLAHMHHSLVTKLSINLFIISMVFFAIALLMLARISKKITKPISMLALASEEIGKGKYEDLQLPRVEKRHDEVEILTHSFQKMVLSLRDREKIRGVLNKVVSKEIASKILKGTIELGGEERVLTMLFCDIRGFTPLSETLEPPALIALLNTYMTRMCRIVDETHGVVDKFVGDEIMALYGAPVELPDHAEKAIEAALLMVADLKNWNAERGAKEPQIETGFGIHTGEAAAGNMGSENRLNYTVVGANVNLAARLCAAAKPMQILISEETYKALANPKKFVLHKLDPIPLKGIDHPVPVYEVTAGSE